MSPVARLLALLDLDALTELADALGLDVPDGADDASLRDRVERHEHATLHAVLAALPRETLKSTCKALVLPADGRGRAALVRRLADALAVNTSAPTRTLHVEVFPRQPRLAWNGMDQREAVAAVPTQVVEIVRPARAVDRESGDAPELPGVNVTAAGARRTADEPNRLIWTNDNLVALRALLDERDPVTHEHRYKGKVDLVYIDPPFMVGSDFRGDNTVDIPIDDDEGIVAHKEPSLVEFIAYRDTWRNGLDSFLAMLRRRLELLKELLAPTGSIYVHLDWHAVHYVKVLMDEIFGYKNFRNEIIWLSTNAHNDAKRFGNIHQTLLYYTATSDRYFVSPTIPHDASYVRKYFSRADDRGKFRPGDLTAPGTRNGETGKAWRGVDPNRNGRHWAVPPSELDKLDKDGRVFWTENGIPRLKEYVSELDGAPVQSVWSDEFSRFITSWGNEDAGYPTQKPVALLERIISASCPPGGLVLDCFMGSGTTVEAAERLGRRWVGVDCGKYAVHLARKRLILLHGTPRPPEKPGFDYKECDRCGNIERKPKKQRSPGLFQVRPFTLENMGVYQRAEQWQDFQRERSRYRDEMVKVFGAEPVEVSPLLHGKKPGNGPWVHVGPLDGPVSNVQVWAIAREAAKTDCHAVTVLSADFDTLTTSEKDEVREKTGVTVTVRIIPSQAIDEVKRRIEAQRNGGATVIESMAVPAFYAPLSLHLATQTEGRVVTVKLARCEVDHESFLASQRPALKPLESATTAAMKKRVAEEHKRWEARRKELLAWLDRARSWQHFVDFWAVDWRYGERSGADGKPIFETAWQSFRTRDGKGEAGGLVFEAKLQYERAGTYRVAARVTDVFGNDGIATAQVTVK